MSKRRDSSRFDEFEEFKDGSGFTIYENDRYIEFYFDKFRGWFDEDGNYFNQDGVRSKPSSESLKFWDSIKNLYQSDDIEDLVNQYDDYYEDDEDPDEQEIALQITRQIHDLKIKLNPYPNNQEIKIFFEGLNWKLDEKKVQQYLGQQHVKKVELYRTDLGHKNGKGFVIAYNKQAALEIIKFHKTEIDGQYIRFHIEALTYDSDEDVTIIKQDEQLKAQIKEITQQIKVDAQIQHQKVEKQEIKQEVKQEIKQEVQQIKQEQVQQKQDQQSQQKQQENFVVVSNLPQKESQEALIDWILNKGQLKTWSTVGNRNDKDGNRCRFDFNSEGEAENFKTFIEKNKAYKGKTTLKVEKRQA